MHIYIYIYTFMYTYIYVFMYIYMYMYIYIYIYVYVYIYVYLYICIRICISIYMYVCMYVILGYCYSSINPIIHYSKHDNRARFCDLIFFCPPPPSLARPTFIRNHHEVVYRGSIQTRRLFIFSLCLACLCLDL
jgi:hypothetical protein